MGVGWGGVGWGPGPVGGRAEAGVARIATHIHSHTLQISEHTSKHVVSRTNSHGVRAKSCGYNPAVKSLFKPHRRGIEACDHAKMDGSENLSEIVDTNCGQH